MSSRCGWRSARQFGGRIVVGRRFAPSQGIAFHRKQSRARHRARVLVRVHGVGVERTCRSKPLFGTKFLRLFHALGPNNVWGALSATGDESIMVGFAFPALKTYPGSASRGAIFCIVRLRIANLGRMLIPNNAKGGSGAPVTGFRSTRISNLPENHVPPPMVLPTSVAEGATRSIVRTLRTAKPENLTSEQCNKWHPVQQVLFHVSTTNRPRFQHPIDSSPHTQGKKVRFAETPPLRI